MSKLALGKLQRVLRTLALDKLPDLVADGCHHVEQILVRLPNVTAEEFDDAEDLTAQQDREGKGPVQAFVCGDVGTRKIPIMGNIRDVRRRTARPDSARQPPAWREGARPSDC